MKIFTAGAKFLFPALLIGLTLLIANAAVADDPPEESCVCTDIEVRPLGVNTVAALGPDAVAGGKNWPPLFNTEDGITLGPLNLNPANAVWPNNNPGPGMQGEHWFFGYAFEVVATVDGDPNLCTPNQLIKSTRTLKSTKGGCDQANGHWDPATGVCTIYKTWDGTRLDLDLDGRPLDVSNQFNCILANGEWINNKCHLEAGVDARGYLPDMPPLPDKHVKRVGDKIIWYDVPKLGPVRHNGMTMQHQIVAYVRGTDDKFCYAKMTLNAKTKPGQDDESLTLIDIQKGGQSAIPGVPSY